MIKSIKRASYRPQAVIVAVAVAAIGYFVVHSGRAATLVGDLNNDGVVNILDLSELLSSWGTTNATIANNLDKSGPIGIVDLSILLSHWGQAASTPTPTPTPSQTPAPSATPTPSPTPTTTPVSQSCTNPTWSTSDAEGTESIGSDMWWVNNDAWSGSHGPQTINVCSASSWYAVSNQPNNGGQVETYPDTEYDVGGRGTPSTKTIAQWNSITSTFSEAYPSAGSWDAAYDLWTDNWSNETMVWNQWTGTEDYWGSCAEPGSSQNDCVGSGGASGNSQAATIDGVAYHFLALGSNCSAANESNCEYIFFRDTQVASGSVDILAIYQWEVANGYAKSSDVPTQLEYGVEVCSTSGSETFPMTGLTFNLN
jgi:hypothetical protein